MPLLHMQTTNSCRLQPIEHKKVIKELKQCLSKVPVKAKRISQNRMYVQTVVSPWGTLHTCKGPSVCCSRYSKPVKPRRR